MIKTNKKVSMLLKVIGAILLPFLIEILKFRTITFDKMGIIRIAFVYAIYLMIGIYFLLRKNKEKVKKIVEYIMKYRYIIAGIVLVVGVLCKVNFSSIGMSL